MVGWYKKWYESLTKLRDSLEEPVFDEEHLEKFEKEQDAYDNNIAQANAVISHFDGMKRVIDKVESEVPSFDDIKPRELTKDDLEPKSPSELASHMFVQGLKLTVQSYQDELLARKTGSKGQTLETKKMSVVLDDEAKDLLVERGYDPKLGARP